MNPARKPAFYMLTAILLIGVLLVILELTARLVAPPYYRFNNRSHEYYTNPRGYHHVVRMDGNLPVFGLDYNLSPQLYRLPLNAPKDYLENRNFEILGLGDSFVHGAGVEYKDTCLARLESILAASRMNLHIKNCSVPGADLNFIVKTYQTESRKQDYPLVIYGFVLNDLGLPGRERIRGSDFIDQNNGPNVYTPWRDRLAIVNLVEASLDKIRLHNQTTRAYLDAFEPDRARPALVNLKIMADDIRAGGGQLVLVIFPLLYDFNHYRFEKCHALMRDFAHHNNIPVLDLLPAFSRHAAPDLWVNPTDHHPNETAHAIAARELFDFLKEENLLPSAAAEKGGKG
ncbi:MAG: SGNH/GDSL hydrolase family protein [Desulfatibacillum sp.]|nr:SGNH/GDSL hydrolase family protein [Desulfatibacillum sp.]